VGTTVMGIIAGSDKAVVTRGTGGLQMHPTFLTLANINSEVHMKATSHAWMCTAFMPIVTFNDYEQITPDPHGILRVTFMPLVVWVADLPEQQLIACTSKSVSPISLAT
ncbi:hypothetical protein SERLA73DRAFT_26656, partial [Serpula lacrymans var. lacrymans S7.3]